MNADRPPPPVTPPRGDADRHPPPVTVRDPARPRPAAEVLEARAPTSRRVRRATGLLVAVLLVLGVALTRHQGTVDRDRRERALATVVVTDPTAVDVPPRAGRYDRAAARLELRNPGPVAVVVESVTVPGWQVGPAAGRLGTGGHLTVDLSAPLACDALPLPGAITVLLRTPGGRRVRRRLPVVAQDLLSYARADCGQVPVEAALDTGTSSAVVLGKELLLDLEVLDRASTPLRLVSVSGDGARVVVSPRLPVDLPPRVPGRVARRRPLHLRLRVVSCRDAVGGFFGPGLTELHLEAESGPTGLATSTFAPSADFLSLLHRLVDEACPVS